jgi:amino acid permease
MIQGLLKDFKVEDPEQYKILHVCVVSLFILFPVCLLKDVSGLRYGTFISIGAVLYTSILLLIELFFFWDSEKAAKEIVFFLFDANFFSAFGITFFAFYCQANFFTSVKNMLKLDEEHLNKVRIELIDRQFKGV